MANGDGDRQDDADLANRIGGLVEVTEVITRVVGIAAEQGRREFGDGGGCVLAPILLIAFRWALQTALKVGAGPGFLPCSPAGPPRYLPHGLRLVAVRGVREQGRLLADAVLLVANELSLGLGCLGAGLQGRGPPCWRGGVRGVFCNEVVPRLVVACPPTDAGMFRTPIAPARSPGRCTASGVCGGLAYDRGRGSVSTWGQPEGAATPFRVQAWTSE